MTSWPLFLRKFIVDFVETGIAALLTITVAFPTTTDQAKQVAAIVILAVVGAMVSALRRAAPDFIVWLKAKLGTTT